MTYDKLRAGVALRQAEKCLRNIETNLTLCSKNSDAAIETHMASARAYEAFDKTAPDNLSAAVAEFKSARHASHDLWQQYEMLQSDLEAARCEVARVKDFARLTGYPVAR